MPTCVNQSVQSIGTPSSLYCHSPCQILRFPHFTAVRPVTVLHCGEEGEAAFKEKLFVRGLVSTLIGNATDVAAAAGRTSAPLTNSVDDSVAAGAGGGRLVPELIWWDPLQSRLGMQDRALARCEPGPPDFTI